MRRNAVLKRFAAAAIGGLLVAGLLTACGGDDNTGGGGGGTDKIVMGFAQTGAESAWRTANTQSVKDSAAAAGIELKFVDGQGKQENQIAAIRSFIAQGVDIIAFSPLVETGWDAVLNEAKTAGIPVILTDRAIDSPDTSLYKTFLGSDFIAEGKKAGDWVNKEYASAPGPVNIVVLEGTTGSAPANDRKTGFNDVVTDPKFKIIASQTGEFTRAKGKEVMEAFLQAHKDINLLYAHNDDMGLGAIEAIQAAGKVPGKDIKIVTVDAVKDGMQALADGKINYIVECSPLLGTQLMELAKKVVAKQDVPARVVTVETVFDQQQAKDALPTRKY
jgi:ABC-type sugar transport system substrate-binding protein